MSWFIVYLTLDEPLQSVVTEVVLELLSVSFALDKSYQEIIVNCMAITEFFKLFFNGCTIFFKNVHALENQAVTLLIDISDEAFYEVFNSIVSFFIKIKLF